MFFENKIERPVYGMEGWGAWQVMRPWRVTGGLSTQRKRLRLEPGSTDRAGVRKPDFLSDPGHHWSLRSLVTPAPRHEIDVLVRGVAALTLPVVPAYTAIDARYGWRALPDLELSVVGQNLLDPRHPEFNAAPNRSEFERAVFLQARWFR